jgi:Ni/Co efflux regulator RcnB
MNFSYSQRSFEDKEWTMHTTRSMTMKITKIVCAVAAASLSFGGIAFAQGDSPNIERPMTAQHNAQQNRGSQQQNRGSQQQNRGSQQQTRGSQQTRDSQPAMNRSRPVAAHEERGAGPEHNFYSGGRLPNEYRGRQYVVDDWRGHHLSAPPRGYHWVQAGGDYVLVAIVSGVIASILLNSN